MKELVKVYVYMALLLVILSLIFLVGCSISLNMTDTHGVSDDVVDSVPTTTSETEADLSIPSLHP